MKRAAIFAASVAGIAGLVPVMAAAQEIETFDSPNQTQVGNGNFKFANPISGSWASSNGGVITNNPTNITITTNAPSNVGGYGTAYHNIYSQDNPSVIDISGSNMLQLDVTVNSGDAGLFVDLQDGEGDYWQYFYGYGLTGSGNAPPQEPGETITQLPNNELILDVPLATPYNNEGSPTFDFTQLVLFRLEDDPGPSLANSISFNDLSAVFVPPTLTWNNTGAAAPTNGTTWDITNNNWNNGSSAATYADGDKVIFNDTNNNNYAVTLNTTVMPGSVTISTNATSAPTYTISGTGKIAGTSSLTKTGTGIATIATPNTYTGGTFVNGGTLVIAPTTTANQVALPNGAVSIGAAGTLQLADNASASTPFVNSAADISNQLMQMSTLSITAGGVLDVRNNHFYVADPGGLAHDSTFATILGYVSNGVTNPTGGEITSTEGLPGYGVGIVDGNDGILGTNVSANQIEVAYTLEGDANLDGKVDITDFNIFAPAFGLPTTLGWEAGDFNYSGTVDIGDFNLFAGNFGLSDNGTAISIPAADIAALNAFEAANGLTLTSVPEPATLGLLTFGAIGLLARRRRQGRRGPDLTSR